jgi:hypothetical protein
MVERRADLDYGADDTTLADDLTHQPSDEDVLIVDETVIDDGSAETRVLDDGEVNPEASNYGSP